MKKNNSHFKELVQYLAETERGVDDYGKKGISKKELKKIAEKVVVWIFHYQVDAENKHIDVMKYYSDFAEKKVNLERQNS